MVRFSYDTDVDPENTVVNLDRAALLLPATASSVDTPSTYSAPLLAYVAMKHWDVDLGEMTLDPVCEEFATLQFSELLGDPYNFNFLDGYDPVAVMSSLARKRRYSRILLSYILWACSTAEATDAAANDDDNGIGNDTFAQLQADTAVSAADAGLPLRPNLRSPKVFCRCCRPSLTTMSLKHGGAQDQAISLGLYDPDKDRWPLLATLPVLPARANRNDSGIVYGQGGVQFLGEEM